MTELTIESRLAEIRARVEKATPGPWEAGPRDGGLAEVNTAPAHAAWLTDTTRPVIYEVVNQALRADAEFIAASRTDLPALLAGVEAVRELHQPVEVEPSETICAGCSTLRGQGETARYFPFTEYPCPTVTRIQEALNGIA